MYEHVNKIGRVYRLKNALSGDMYHGTGDDRKRWGGMSRRYGGKTGLTVGPRQISGRSGFAQGADVSSFKVNAAVILNQKRRCIGEADAVWKTGNLLCLDCSELH